MKTSGEDPSGPDITTVRVSNDDNGTITLRIDVPTHPTLGEDMRLRVWFPDGDPATGLSEGGADAFILADAYLLGPGRAALYTCRGNTCSPVWPDRAASTSLRFSHASGARFSFDAADLGIDSALGSATPIQIHGLGLLGRGVRPCDGIRSLACPLRVCAGPG